MYFGDDDDDDDDNDDEVDYQGEWESWGACSASCGAGGVQSRERPARCQALSSSASSSSS